MASIFPSGVAGALACGLALVVSGTADASENRNYRCGSNGIAIAIEIEPETGTARIESPRGIEQLRMEDDGVWRDASQVLQFMDERTPPMLYMGPEQFDCRPAFAGGGQTHASGAVGGNERPVNMAGRSLGGRLRNGPGTNFSSAGSLAENDPVTIVANTGVRFDGYDWFEVKIPGGGTAYQWGGIMCSEGRMIEGVFEACRSPAQTGNAGGAGFMAFAVGRDGRFGHGKAATRRDAEGFALQYCGADCRVEDVTTAQCHAFAAAPGGFWFGAAATPVQAQDLAMDFCRNAGARDCRIDYSICQ
ncbi:MAG: DUF4189 domain-containing protein [Hoeflea sp.]|uniref:DUF4189 domain-containing protein n=1 Tax=Hoeflea sp. TaxID=1940281 RepID=UPI0032EB8BCE